MLVDATAQAITFEFVSRTGQVIDSSTIRAAGAAPAGARRRRPGSSRPPASPTQVNLSWAESAPPAWAASGSSGRPPASTFAEIAETASGVTTYQDTSASPGVSYTYRVRALVDTTPVGSSTHSELDSAYSAAAAATTPALPTTPVTSLSTLTYDRVLDGPRADRRRSITSYFGTPTDAPRSRSRSTGSRYARAWGRTRPRQLVYNLGGQYSYFLSDIGIDDEQAGNPASVDFQVLADGKTVFDSGLMLTNSPTQHVDLNVAGVQQLTLVVERRGRRHRTTTRPTGPTPASTGRDPRPRHHGDRSPARPGPIGLVHRAGPRSPCPPPTPPTRPRR